MTFNLGAHRVIVQPEPFSGMMGGFVGPARILETSAPFTRGLEASKERKMGLVAQGMADAASIERSNLANDVTLKVAKMREEGGDRAALVNMLGASPRLSQGFAGQVFGVGGQEGSLNSTQRLTSTLNDQNDYLEALRRNRTEQLWWSQGSFNQAGAMLGALPKPPTSAG